jgi:hypothetical protein
MTDMLAEYGFLLLLFAVLVLPLIAERFFSRFSNKEVKPRDKSPGGDELLK